MLYAYVYVQLMLTIITKILVREKSGILLSFYSSFFLSNNVFFSPFRSTLILINTLGCTIFFQKIIVFQNFCIHIKCATKYCSCDFQWYWIRMLMFHSWNEFPIRSKIFIWYWYWSVVTVCVKYLQNSLVSDSYYAHVHFIECSNFKGLYTGISKQNIRRFSVYSNSNHIYWHEAQARRSIFFRFFPYEIHKFF